MRHNALKTFDGKAAATTDQIPAPGPALSDAAPAALAETATPGTAVTAARADHVHPTTGLATLVDGKVPAGQLPAVTPSITAAEVRKIAMLQAIIFG